MEFLSGYNWKIHDLRFQKCNSVTTHKSQSFQIIWWLWWMVLLNFYRKLWFSIGDWISIGWHRNNIHFQNISRSAAQMYQSLTASFGFVEFLSGTLNFYRECNFYRVHWKTSHSTISIGDKRTLTDISDVPAFENISVEWFCWISIGNFEFYRKFKFCFDRKISKQ